MINFTGIIKINPCSDKSIVGRYLNTDSIRYIRGNNYNIYSDNWQNSERTYIHYNDGSADLEKYSPEIWAKAILKANNSNEIVDIDEFAKAEENKLDIEG